MKIVTFNAPEKYFELIEKMIGENGDYVSRSELIRTGIRDFLEKELPFAKSILSDEDIKHKKEDSDNYDKEKFVRVPITDSDDSKLKYKEFKIIKKMI